MRPRRSARTPAHKGAGGSLEPPPGLVLRLLSPAPRGDPVEPAVPDPPRKVPALACRQPDLKWGMTAPSGVRRGHTCGLRTSAKEPIGASRHGREHRNRGLHLQMAGRSRDLKSARLTLPGGLPTFPAQ